jgi:hypothetical protein
LGSADQSDWASTNDAPDRRFVSLPMRHPNR